MVHTVFSHEQPGARTVPDVEWDGKATASTYGYDRASVDAFFGAVDEERARLEAVIADARARAGRAQEVVDGRRLLVAMIDEACDELAAKRSQADVVAGRLAHPNPNPDPMPAPDRAVAWRVEYPPAVAAASVRDSS